MNSVFRWFITPFIQFTRHMLITYKHFQVHFQNEESHNILSTTLSLSCCFLNKCLPQAWNKTLQPKCNGERVGERPFDQQLSVAPKLSVSFGETKHNLSC